MGEESEDSEDTDTASIGAINEPFGRTAPGILSPPSPVYTRSYGKAKKTKDIGPF